MTPGQEITRNLSITAALLDRHKRTWCVRACRRTFRPYPRSSTTSAGSSAGQLGREVKATPGSTAKVLTNQTFAWKPSITGTASKDTIVVAAGGTELLTPVADWPTVEADVNDESLRGPDIRARS